MPFAGSLDSWALPVVTAAALGAVLWSMHHERRGRATFVLADPMSNKGAATRDTSPTTPYEPDAKPASPRRKTGAFGREQPVDWMDLDFVLRRVTDVSVPVRESGTPSDVPYTDDEVRSVVGNVLARVNDEDRSWDLRLVAIDGVRKAVDAYKTLFYTLTFTAYSTDRNVGIKLLADVAVPTSNVIYVRKVQTFNTPMPDEVQPSPGPDKEPQLAAWEPII
jgi:hypothetical protein